MEGIHPCRTGGKVSEMVSSWLNHGNLTGTTFHDFQEDSRPLCQKKGMVVITIPETYSSHLKMAKLRCGMAYFQVETV